MGLVVGLPARAPSYTLNSVDPTLQGKTPYAGDRWRDHTLQFR